MREKSSPCDLEAYDEFGFRVEVEDSAPEVDRDPGPAVVPDNPQQRLKWIAHLEFAQNSSSEIQGSKKRSDDRSAKAGKLLAWETMGADGIIRTKKLRQVIQLKFNISTYSMDSYNCGSQS